MWSSFGKDSQRGAANFGGSGGGHDKSAGAVIPKDHLDEFINELDRKI